jgi:Methylmalonyl-CoA mutase
LDKIFTERAVVRAQATYLPAAPPDAAGRLPARQPGHDRRERLHRALRDVDVADAELAAPLLQRVAELARATEEEKKSQLERVRDFTERHREQAHAAVAALQETARSGGNVFAVLMDAARVCSLQQITEAFFEVGGQYRRNV